MNLFSTSTNSLLIERWIWFVAPQSGTPSCWESEPPVYRGCVLAAVAQDWNQTCGPLLHVISLLSHPVS